MSTHLSIPMNQTTSHAAHSHRIGLLGWIAILAGAVCFGLLIWGSLAHGDDSHAAHATTNELPPYWQLGILPFIGVLGSIAFLPLIPRTHHWWENNLNRLCVSLVMSAVTLFYVTIALGLKKIPLVLEHALIDEYIPFIVLLFSLYVVSGGIRLSGDLRCTPATNTAILAIGAGLASFIGTTGASMLLIRPLLQTNSGRRYTLHTVIFFIFLVSNIGGTLLPIGDPPLFLGYLRGVEFFWTLNLWVEWAFCCIILLVLYYFWDKRCYAREDDAVKVAAPGERAPLRIEGWHNSFFLVCIVLSVAFLDPNKAIPGTNWHPFPFMREMIMLATVALALLSTRPEIRIGNRFNYHAILEVAALFIGIFITMQIPLMVLKAYGPSITQSINEPWQFFWMTGSLSSFHYKAPTYVVFFELARSMPPEDGVEAYQLIDGTTLPLAILIAISLGSVFMGAMTYIGNGPNFMVKSIAEQAGIRMPSFFGFMIRFSIPILVPIFILMTLIFLL